MWKIPMFKPDPQLEKLTSAVQELVIVNKALLKKLEEQQVSLTALTRFVKDNSASKPICGVI